LNAYLKTLSEAVTAMHGCDCLHLETVHVHETHAGKTVWEGDVEVFELVGHSQAVRAFTWGWESGDGNLQTIAVLNVPPIDSAQRAVQAAIASGSFK